MPRASFTRRPLAATSSDWQDPEAILAEDEDETYAKIDSTYPERLAHLEITYPPLDLSMLGGDLARPALVRLRIRAATGRSVSVAGLIQVDVAESSFQVPVILGPQFEDILTPWMPWNQAGGVGAVEVAGLSVPSMMAPRISQVELEVRYFYGELAEIRAPSIAWEPLVLKQGDSAPALRGQILDDGAPFDLAGCRVYVRLRSKDRALSIDGVAEVEDEEMGFIRFAWEAGDIDEPTQGDIDAEVTIERTHPTTSVIDRVTVPRTGYGKITVNQRLQ